MTTLPSTFSLPLASYAGAIGLHDAFGSAPTFVGDEYNEAIRTIARWLSREAPSPDGLATFGGGLRRTIDALLTMRPPTPIPTDIHRSLDGVLAREAAERPTISMTQCLGPSSDALVGPSIGHAAVRVWQGDIRFIAADAIVNAANEKMLGCFVPHHPCIDNAIHAAAGPRLREDCRRIMAIQGHDEFTGDAKITRAYHLPSRFILHTVGPIVRNGTVQPDDVKGLARCYRACLDLAAAIPSIRSVAFCGISTGIFGYPKQPAALVALETVLAWLNANPSRLDAVVFDAFSDDDREAYASALVSAQTRGFRE